MFKCLFYYILDGHVFYVISCLWIVSAKVDYEELSTFSFPFSPHSVLEKKKMLFIRGNKITLGCMSVKFNLYWYWQGCYTLCIIHANFSKDKSNAKLHREVSTFQAYYKAYDIVVVFFPVYF